MPDLCDTPTPSRLRRRKNCGRSAPTVRLLRLSRGELLSGLVRLGFTDAQTFRAGAGMWESLVQPLCVGADDTNAQRLGHAVPSPRSSAGQVTLRRAAICLAVIIIRLSVVLRASVSTDGITHYPLHGQTSLLVSDQWLSL